MKKPLPRANRIIGAGRGRAGNISVEELVASVLSFLAADAELFDRFLATTGMSVADLRAAAQTPGFAEHLLDYLCSDERLLVAYADATAQAPDAIDAVRRSLAPASWDP